jgi:hypothetical protein
MISQVTHTSTRRLGERGHVPYGQGNWRLARLAICDDGGRHHQDSPFLGLLQILFIFAARPFPVVVGVLVAVGKAVVEFGVTWESGLSDSRDAIEICLGGLA